MLDTIRGFVTFKPAGPLNLLTNSSILFCMSTKRGVGTIAAAGIDAISTKYSL